MRVLVTGSSGRTGTIVVRKLLERGKEAFTVRGLVRNGQGLEKLQEHCGGLACDLEVVQGDVTVPETLAEAMESMEALVILTSAMPQISKLSLAATILVKLGSLGFASRKPSFYFNDGQTPEMVDWIAQRDQIEAAKAAGVKHIVLVSSMAGTKPDHFLNTNMEDIVLWKRRAECHLIASGVPYTIIHPGGLLPHFGHSKSVTGGKRQLFLGVDDQLMDDGHSQVPREDVAEIAVQCLLEPSSKNRSFDLGSAPEGEGEVFSGDFKALLGTLDGKDCSYSATDADFPGRPSNDKARDCC